MPTYDYQCENCGRTFEYFQAMSDSPLTECQECKGTLRRLIGGGLGVIFKGSGFYITDNKSKNSSNAASAAASGTESAAAGNSEASTPPRTESKKETVKTTS